MGQQANLPGRLHFKGSRGTFHDGSIVIVRAVARTIPASRTAPRRAKVSDLTKKLAAASACGCAVVVGLFELTLLEDHIDDSVLTRDR